MNAPSDPRVRRGPAHPERVCWGCEKHCPIDRMKCGGDKIRTPHPMELFGEEWVELADQREHEAEEYEQQAVECEASADEPRKAVASAAAVVTLCDTRRVQVPQQR